MGILITRKPSHTIILPTWHGGNRYSTLEHAASRAKHHGGHISPIRLRRKHCCYFSREEKDGAHLLSSSSDFYRPSVFFILMNSILNLGQISPSLLTGGNGHQTAHGSCDADEWELAGEKGRKRRWTVTQLRMTVFGSTVGSSERQETRHCWTTVSLAVLGEWVEAELGPATRLMSSCTRAYENLQLPQSRPTAAHLLTLRQSVKSKTVTGERRICCWVCGRNCAATHSSLCTENSLAV